MSGSAYWNIEGDKRKLKICQEAGARMAPAIGGSVKVRDDGDEVHVTGQYGQHKVRVVIWVTFANMRFQVKPHQELDDEKFDGLSFEYNQEAAENAGEQLDRDEWDDDDDAKLFLSKTVYMEGGKGELRQMKTWYDQLPPQVMQQLVQVMEGTKKDATNFRLDNEEIDFYYNNSDITLSKTADQRIAQIFHLLTSIMTSAEQLWGPGGAQPGAQPQAAQPPAAPAPAGPPPGAPPGAPALQPGSQVLVAWSDGNRYPATVVQAAPDQYLCAFPNGQQQWIGSQFVAPAS